MKNKLIEFYLDWANNYLTIPVMAKHYEISERHCAELIEIGRSVHAENHKYVDGGKDR